MATIFPLSASVGQEFEGYIYDGTIWNLTGNEYNPTVYSAYEPDNPKPGDLWVDSSIDVPVLSIENVAYQSDLNNYLTISSASSTYLTQSSASSIYLSQSAASANYATKAYSDNSASIAAAAIVDAAPSTLNTLNELAAALNDDANFATTVTNSLSNKLDISSASVTYATKEELNSFSSETFLIKQENYLSSIDDTIFVNTASGSYTVTLPSSVSLGAKVKIIDLSNNASVNNIIVNRNGNRIDGLLENFVIDVNNASVEFIYTNTTYGWRTLNG